MNGHAGRINTGYGSIHGRLELEILMGQEY